MNSLKWENLQNGVCYECLVWGKYLDCSREEVSNERCKHEDS